MRRFEVDERADCPGTKTPALAFVWEGIYAPGGWKMNPIFPCVAVFGTTGYYREVSHVIQYAE